MRPATITNEASEPSKQMQVQSAHKVPVFLFKQAGGGIGREAQERQVSWKRPGIISARNRCSASGGGHAFTRVIGWALFVRLGAYWLSTKEHQWVVTLRINV